MPLENADSKLKTGKSLNIEGEYTNIGKTNDVQASKFTLTYRNKFQGLERDKKLYYKTNNTFTNNRNYSRILNNRVYFPTSDYTSRVYEARKVDEQEMWQFDTKHHFAYKQMHWSLGIRSEKKEEDRNSQERSETNDSLISAVSMQYRLKNVNSSGNAELSLILLKKINFNSSFDFGQRKTESLQIDTISESNRHFLLDQKYDHQNMEWTTTISYGRMLSLFSSLFEYTYRTSMNKENGESVNRLTNSLDTNGTRDYSFYQQIHELSGRLNYYSKKTSILANITLQRLFRNRVERFPHRVQLRDDFLPLRVQLTIEMKSSPTFNWNMGYQLTPSIPGLANTRREIETSNPMFLHAGNPNLKPSKSHMIYVTFNQLFVSKASHLMGVVNYSLETDYFAMSERYFPQTTYLPEYDYTVMAGATLMVPRNTKAHHQLLVNATYSTYSGLLKSKLNIKTIYEYKKIPSFTQGQVNDQQTNKWSLGLGLITSFSRKVEFNLSSYTSVLNTQSDLDRANNILTQNASLAFRSRIISKYTFSATYSYAYSKNYATGHDTGLPELKMEIERNLGRFTSLKLEGINLLNRQNGVSFGKTATFTSRTESARTGGYVMLTFSQKLR